MTERPLKVLLAEDDPVTAQVVIRGLARDPGLEVVHVADGSAALATVEHDDIVAAILDIRLPAFDGLYVLLTIRENPRFQKLPVIMLTALGSEADVIRGFELGADDYVVKPFSAKELTLRLQRLLGRRPARPSRLSSAQHKAPTVDPAPPPDPDLPPYEFEASESASAEPDLPLVDLEIETDPEIDPNIQS
jgi:DNA-binding response OmpR family regulator